MPPRVLLSSVFKPFGIDNIYSRRESKIELFHNQLTKAQGPFSIRNFYHTFGLHLIAKNISAPTTVLDFPTLDRFRREVKKGYDIVGLGAITPNFQKVKRMVEETRELSPGSTIVLGGFCASVPDIEKMMKVDYVCVGDGITFMRDLLGEPQEFRFQNPDIWSETREIFGAPVFGARNPQIVVGLGCSYGCDFCSPSHFFGRRHIKFFKNGDELYQEMLRVERRFGSLVIGLVGDDNFLLDLTRAEELRRRVVEGGKVWNLFIFGSADKAAEFGPEKLAEMGVSTIWIGRESRFSEYPKMRRVNLPELIAGLRSYGIKTILSSILLVDRHTKENIGEDIDEHLAAGPTFSQFCHYGPLPGTPLYDRMNEDGRLLTAIPYEEWHGFKQPWFVHPAFTLAEAEQIQERAYQRDFHELGPSLMRFIAAELEGWRNLRNSSRSHLRARAKYFAGQMWKYKVMLLTMEYAAPSREMKCKVRETRERVESSFGKAGALEKSLALGLAGTSRWREFRSRRWGDAVQPRTRVAHYN
ncbi:MAG TPA: cobalamin-dependent protein [bacterium]|nr:cobalamin-dependent protein [bacterium]